MICNEHCIFSSKLERREVMGGKGRDEGERREREGRKKEKER